LTGAISVALERSDEAPFWAQKTIPYVKAISSVLFPLRDQNLLFDPEGKRHETLTPSLFLRLCYLMNLKTIAFNIDKSNEAGK